jgi:hypothetical protein
LFIFLAFGLSTSRFHCHKYGRPDGHDYPFFTFLALYLPERILILTNII